MTVSKRGALPGRKALYSASLVMPAAVAMSVMPRAAGDVTQRGRKQSPVVSLQGKQLWPRRCRGTGRHQMPAAHQLESCAHLRLLSQPCRAARAFARLMSLFCVRLDPPARRTTSLPSRCGKYTRHPAPIWMRSSQTRSPTGSTLPHQRTRELVSPLRTGRSGAPAPGRLLPQGALARRIARDHIADARCT